MTGPPLQPEDHERDARFTGILHGKSSEAHGGFRAMRSKDAKAHEVVADEYFKHWGTKEAGVETADDRAARRSQYANLTQQYYNLSTDLYENGWCQSFHFCRFAPGERFHQAIARHEHYLAMRTGIKEGMKVLDVGCGVGGPAREIAKFSNAHITGLNNNDYQIQRATRYAQQEGLSDRLDFVKGDFMQMGFPDNHFDAIYAIEATVHAPDLEGVYREIFRVLKPGGVFGVYEWLMLDSYDDSDTEQRQIRQGIEQGNGISNMVKVADGLAAIRNAGFELVFHDDLAAKGDTVPWYYPIAGDFKHMGSIWDFLTIARMTWWGRGLAHSFIGAMENLRLFPRGSRKAAENLGLASDCLVAGARQNIFTPMYLMIGKKPMA
ncbi:hypothetical protein ASPZODRAFT_1138566 [Penicilliopsis zonata CBS 506.65]|uniref:Sterol 24-C-methyltransferase n=1 Tax=Penicilliopsis zonata CBS 506.65 TaxID=1073090 RepID=A0A1L9SSU8_9EURO|nr:hypothetical protein ASPZODRAFT_1138566 [Penicilliopsis zonata CBS 506.65]OJJ50288.1 hypothetical protein ASPZODRAFT_1138566 [Penicilliopsis zonata CBS 506.65]